MIAAARGGQGQPSPRFTMVHKLLTTVNLGGQYQQVKGYVYA